MWQPDVQPEFSFERAARELGSVNRARDLWSYYEVMEKKAEQEADALEQAMAHGRRNKTYIVNEELEGEVAWKMAPWSFVRIKRASMHERGCVGGELLDDSNYMKWLLKRNPALRVTCGSGKIMSGWTPEQELSRAKLEGESQRQLETAERGGILTP